MGGPLPVLHGREGDARPQPAGSRQEAAGPVSALPSRPGHRRPGHGESLPTIPSVPLGFSVLRLMDPASLLLLR